MTSYTSDPWAYLIPFPRQRRFRSKSMPVPGRPLVKKFDDWWIRLDKIPQCDGTHEVVKQNRVLRVSAWRRVTQSAVSFNLDLTDPENVMCVFVLLSKAVQTSFVDCWCGVFTHRNTAFLTVRILPVAQRRSTDWVSEYTVLNNNDHILFIIFHPVTGKQIWQKLSGSNQWCKQDQIFKTKTKITTSRPT